MSEVLEVNNIKSHSRPTIMDGKVVTFATDFEPREGCILSDSQDAIGPFKISASRNAVIVHDCSLTENQHFVDFQQAMQQAREEYVKLSNQHWSDR